MTSRIDVIGTNGNDGAHYDQGIKYDADKPMMDLIPPIMEMEVAHVLTFGAAKYGRDNWRRVPDLRRRYIAAAKRHINALQQGVTRDEETGLHHAAHAVCCLMFLGEVELESGTTQSGVPGAVASTGDRSPGQVGTVPPEADNQGAA